MNELKSRQYFPNTEEGQRDYERQWEGNKQCSPIKVSQKSKKEKKPELPENFLTEQKSAFK